MRKSYREVNGEKVFRYSIRKYHFGAASVAVAALMFFANGAVKADTLPVSPATANTEKVNVGVTELTEGVPPKENPIEKSKEEVVGDKTPVAQKLVDKSPLVQAISELQAAIAKVDEESLVSLSNQLTKLTDENNRLLNGENTSEEAIASQVSRVQFLTEQVRLLKSKTKDKASNKEDGSGSKAQDKKEVEVSENAVTLVNQTEEIKKSVKDVKVEEVFTNKTKLETLLKEIDKLDPEKYTEDSVKGLKEKVAKAKEVLTIAKNQEEVNSVYKELVNYKNSSLRRVKMTHKPLEENTPKLDTTNGKETVGKKAQNTEPSDRNIAGHNHILNGITLPEGSGLRAAPKPELADVQIGRWNGTRRTFDSSNVFVTPANQGIVGNVMKIKAISASDNFTNIEVTGNQGFPLQVKKKINGKEAELYFEGNTPSNGSWNMTVTATTAKGTKSFNFGYYTALRKPTILTQNTALEGKAKEKPTIEVEVPTFSPAPTGSKFKVYLVRGGSTNGWDNSGNAYPSGYSVLASADVVASTGGKGTAIINASNYRVSELGTTAFKAITVIELNGRENDTDPGERGSWFSDERRATERLANKSALTTALSGETTTKASSAYYNATPEKQRVYDQAIASGKQIKDKANATQTEVDNATSAINNAKQNLGGRDTNKTALTTALSGETTTKASSAYYNATPEKQRVYDQAIASGKQIKDKANATQTEVDNATSAINNAKQNLGGRDTNKTALTTALSGETTTKASSAYYNATPEKQRVYDQAIASGKQIKDKANATQTEVDNATSAINNAKQNLGGRDTNKTALTTALSGETTTKASSAYYNATPEKQRVYDQAIASGKQIKDKANATQTEVDNATSAINNAKQNLGGRDTNKTALTTALSGETTTKASSAYYNATPEKQRVYDQAIASGKQIKDKANATQTEVDNATRAINDAKAALGGQDTNKTALTTALSDDATTKASSAYYNATPEKQRVYDQAIASGKQIKDKANATQTEVDNATSAINNAKQNLGGRDTNKTALTTALSDDATTKASSAYYNATPEKQRVYDQAIASGKQIKDKANATQTEVDNATRAINDAKAALGGQDTNKTALTTALSGETTTKASSAYYNATPEKQRVYDQAIASGKQIKDKANATQTEVDNATRAINDAKAALGGQDTNKTALTTALSGETTTKASSAYYNATPEKQRVYDQAIASGKQIKDKANATQTEVDNATRAINDAKAALGGQDTNKTALTTALSDDATTKASSAYYNATPEKQRVYDQAIASGKQIKDKANATQTEVDNATSVINNAKQNLGGQDTNKTALTTALSDDATTKASSAYYNATPEKQRVYDQAIASGKQIKDKANATQTEVDNATRAINDAKAALGGQDTNKTALTTALSDDATTKASSAYYNATPEKQRVYDQAIASGKQIKDKANATQTEVDNATSVINNAKQNLGGQDTNKTALTTALSDDATTKASSAYYNATPEKQRVYDQAIASGKQIKDKANATQTEVDNATRAINDAKAALGGQDTNKTALTTALSDDATTKASSAYYNATPEKQRVYDQAIASGKQIKDKANATQTEVDNATSVINNAKQNLGGQDTNKTALTTALSDDATTKASSAYYNATPEKQRVYDQAIASGKQIKDKANATQTEVDNATRAINDAKAALGGQDTNKTALTTALSDDATTKASSAYYNATPEKQRVYDQAIASGKQIKDKANATQTEVDNATSVINNAKQNLGGQDTNKTALTTALSDDATTKASSAYYNATPEKQRVYDQAIASGKQIKDKANATQTEVDNATRAINDAKAALGGQDTNKTALTTALSDDATTKASSAYYNATPEKQRVYDQAIASGKQIKDKANATQTEVDNATRAINDAKAALGGQDTNKTALTTALSDDATTKASSAYYNATPEKQRVYDQAIASGKQIKDKANATQTEVDNATRAINDAKAALGGQDTNKTALTTALSGETTTKASSAYYNATPEKQRVYDQAIASGKQIKDKANATQTEVDNATRAINDAKAALGGQDTNKTALTTALSDDATTKASSAYYNATPEKQRVYDQAIASGKQIKDKANATQTEVDNATRAINDAKAALGGQDTNKTALTTALSDDATTKASSAYYNATPEKQRVYDQAIASGKQIKDKANATQTEVDNATRAINDAKAALGGQDTNKTALTTALSDDATTKASSAYYNATPEKQRVYDQAIASGKQIKDKANATQTEVDNATRAINDAKAALGGQDTNKTALTTALSDDATTKASSAYYNATPEKQRVYDQAIASGKQIKDKANATQTEVNDAVSAITNAKNALGGNATNKDALQTATSTGDTETKASAAYYNAEASKKDAYDQAVTAGKVVLAKDNATQTEVNDAVSAITNAKNALGGNATNKDALQTATSTGDTETKASAAYYNAEASKKDAYDQAVTAGKAVLAKDNATQTEVNDAVSAITNAKNALGGNATNKDALQTATSTGDTETKASAAYYNAEASKKTAYDNAVTAGKAVLAKDNATQTEVNNALSAITTAKEKLDGAPFPTEIEKSNAIAEVKKALDTKIKSIESSKEFTDNDKGILKDKAEKAAMAAIVRIKTATTNAAVETAKIEGIERINSIEANLPATLDFPEFTGEVNGEIVEPTETLKEEQGGENKPQPASVVLSDDTTREPEVVTSNSQPVSSENNVPKQNDSKSHAALPNTGTKEDRATGSLGVLSLLGAFGLLFAKKKKDDEEEA